MDFSADTVESIASYIKGIILDISDIQKQKKMLYEVFMLCMSIDTYLFACAVRNLEKDTLEDLQSLMALNKN